MAKSIGKTVAAVVILSSVALSCAATAISIGALTKNEIDWGEGQTSSVPESAAQTRSIVSIEKTETLGLVDKYTITYSDGTTSIFLVTNGKDGEPGIQGLPGPDGRVPTITIGTNGNWFVDGVDQNIRAEGLQGPKGDPGKGIEKIEKTNTYGLIDEYTITYTDNTTFVFLVTNGQDGQQGIQGIQGPDGHTPAIEIGANGNWFIDNVDSGVSATGQAGPTGQNGKSAYELAVEKGYEGTLEEWLLSIVGATGAVGPSGQNGKSAYELAVEKGYEGTEDEWLTTLVGAAGQDGQNGTNGMSAYQIYCEGHLDPDLSETDWLASLYGQNGVDGKSAYEIYITLNPTSTLSESEWLESLVGQNGQDGRGITSITGPETEGSFDTYTINYTDSTTSTFVVRNGADGKNGASLLTGIVDPEASLGANGDSYINTATWEYFTKSGGVWTSKGNIKGTDGASGSNGTNGSSLLTGSDNPEAADGANGDSYINTSTWEYFAKNAGVWTSQGSIRGAAGANGTDGTDGINGSSLLTGADDPDATVGESGDSYINTTTWEYFTRSGNDWTSKGTIKGSDGINGTNGTNGRSLYANDGAPAVTGYSGDSYIDLTTGDYYLHNGTSWILAGNIKGAQGEQGAAGRGITTIALTDSTSETDTYTITYSDATNYSYTIAKPRSIVSIAKTSTSDLVDTYTITYSYGESSTFTVTNGANGLNGQNGKTVLHGEGAPASDLGSQGDVYIDIANFNMYFKGMAAWGDPINFKGAQGQTGVGISTIEKTDTTGLVDTYTITYTNSTTSTFTVRNGADGKDGTRVVTGNTAPSSTTGFQEGDSYIDTTTWNYYVLTMNAGDQLEWQLSGNIKGAAGQNGAAGAPGANGTDGASLLTGSVDPVPAEGSNGDSYINTATWEYFTKSGGTWTSQGTFRGNDGTNGTDGNNGTDGSSLLTGTSNPTSSVGKSGDSYINTSTWEYFTRNGDTWTSHGTIKGSNGTDGTNGKDGTKVVTGDTAPSSTNGFQEGDSYINTSNWNFYVLTAGAGNTLTWTLKGNIHASPNTHTVTFESNGGDEVASITNAVEGCTITKPADPTKSGYFFQGWYTNGGTLWDFTKDVVTKDITLNARWGQFEVTNGVLTGCSLTGDIEIPYVYNGQVVTSIATGLFYNKTGIRKVTVPSTITEIPENAFGQCADLEEVVLPESLTTIGEDAFRRCQKLNKINLPDSITTIGQMAFFNDNGLEAIVLPKGLTSLGDNAFSDCDGIKYVASPDGMSLTTMPDGAFSYCENLEEVVLPDSVTTIDEYCFRWDNNLKKLVTPIASFGHGHDKSVVELFDGEGYGLKEIIVTGNGVIPENAFDGATIQSLSFTGNPSSFAKGCLNGLNSLTTLSLPYLGSTANDYANTGFLSYLFGGTDPVSDASLVPNNLATVEVRGGKIGMNAFTNCDHLKSIIIGKDITGFDYDTTDDSACQPLLGCSSLERLEIPHVGVTKSATGNKAWLKYLFGEGANAADAANSLPATLETVVVTAGLAIRDSAFRKCTNIKNVVLNKGINQVREYAFEGSGIESLVFPDAVFMIEQGFCQNCANLVYVKLPDNKDFTSLPENSFSYTPKLKTVIMGSYINKLGKNCFEASGIDSIDLSNITSLGLSCFESSKIRNVEFNDQLDTIPHSAFRFCEQLESVIIPASVQTIATEAFEKCTSLSSLTFASVDDTAGDLTIGWYSFSGCYSLSSVVLPHRTTSLDREAFSNCKSLIYVRLSSNLQTVRDQCFQDCGSLAYVENTGTGIVIYDNAFSRCVSLRSFTTYDSTYASTAGISKIGYYAFENCLSLETIGLKGLTRVCYQAFGYSGVKNIVLPDTVTTLDNCIFYCCDSLKSITVSNNSSLTTIPAYFCYKCTSLETLVFSNNITEIGSYAFQGTALTSVTIPGSVTNLRQSVFYGCTRLKNIQFPSYGSLIVDVSCFGGCTSLESVTITRGVRALLSQVFEDCTSLKTVTFMQTNGSLDVGQNAFSNTAVTTVNAAMTSSDYIAWINSGYFTKTGNAVIIPGNGTTFNYGYTGS